MKLSSYQSATFLLVNPSVISKQNPNLTSIRSRVRIFIIYKFLVAKFYSISILLPNIVMLSFASENAYKISLKSISIKIVFTIEKIIAAE